MRNLRPVALPAVFTLALALDLALAVASELAVPAAAQCPHDNLLRCYIRSPTLAITFCSWTAGIYPTASTIYATATWTPEPEPTITSTCIASSSSADTPTNSSHDTSTFITQTSTPTTITSVSISTLTTSEPAAPAIPTTTLRPSSSTVNASRPEFPSSSVPAETATIPGIRGGAPCGTGDEDSPDEQRTTARTTSFSSSTAALSPRTGPKTSLACLEDLEPDNEDISSACSCFSRGYSIAPVTSTVTAYPGPTCPGGQPTFPNCFDDFHPYNCGTDTYGVVACSCALTTEDTAACTLGDYERDNACVTSDDCAEGWHCTLIDCFDDDVLSVCTQQCPELFSVKPVGLGQFRIAAPEYSPAERNASDLSIVVVG